MSYIGALVGHTEQGQASEIHFISDGDLDGLADLLPLPLHLYWDPLLRQLRSDPETAQVRCVCHVPHLLSLHRLASWLP